MSTFAEICASRKFCTACRGPAGTQGRAYHGITEQTPCPIHLPIGATPQEVWAALKAEPAASAPKPTPITVRGQTPRRSSPGQLTGIILHRLGYKQRCGCGCAAFAARMDSWGWIGCLTHRAEIVEWFTRKAREQGLPVDSLTTLLIEGLRDLKRKRKSLDTAHIAK